MPKKQGTRKATAAKPRSSRDRRTSQPRYAAAAKLRGQILMLRTLGRTIAEIAEAVNRAPSVVHTHLKHALEEMDAEQVEQASRLRALAFNRLERLLAKAMLKGVTGDLKAMNQAAKLIQAQAKLMGWGMPPTRNPETGEGIGDSETGAPAGGYVLPAVPGVSIEDWQAQAEAIYRAQQQRESEA